jgi:hypothetical protein
MLEVIPLNPVIDRTRSGSSSIARSLVVFLGVDFTAIQCGGTAFTGQFQSPVEGGILASHLPGDPKSRNTPCLLPACLGGEEQAAAALERKAVRGKAERPARKHEPESGSLF